MFQHSTVLEIAHKPGLIDRSQRARPHRYRRELPDRPISYWFKYPVYEVDHKLDTVAIENPLEAQKQKWKTGVQNANQSKHDKTQSDLEEAFNILNDGSDSVAATQMAAYLEVKRTAIYYRVKQNPNYEIVDGNVTKKK